MTSTITSELRELFKKNIVMDIDDLQKQTSSSRITVLRHLKEIGYITSYNKNAKYYTLLEVANFNKTGIFNHKGILFFKNGGIRELVIKEIESSEKGFTAEELNTKIGTRVSVQLHQFVRKNLITRRKYSSFYVYYSIDESTQKKQVNNREKELHKISTNEESELTDEKKTIRILLEIIQNPNAEPNEIGRVMRENGLKISDYFIENIFVKYDLKKNGVTIQLLNDFLTIRNSIPEEMSLLAIESKIQISFRSPDGYCCICNGVFRVLKTQKTTIISLKYGIFYAVETLLFCPEHKYEGDSIIKYDSLELNQIVPPYSNFAYDVSIHIGFSRFLHHKQKSEIMQELKIEYGIKISDGEITHLSDNFLIYCMCVQMMASSRIKKVQDERGGYILHIDATVEEESDMVFVGMNSVNGWVLYTRKIKTESHEEIIPALNEIKRMYGEPLAIKRDMGKGMALAVSKVFPNTPDRICHFHFVRDIGKDILSEQYDYIRNFLIKNKIKTSLKGLFYELIIEIKEGNYDINITLDSIANCRLSELKNNKPVYVYAIITWILNYAKEGEGLGFPFDLPYVSLYERCLKALIIIDRLILLLAELKTVYKPFIQLKKILVLVNNQEIKLIHEKMGYGRTLFSQLREILRIEVESVPLSTVLETNGDEEVFKMKKDLEDFKKELSKDILNDKSRIRENKIVIKHLEKYKDNLFLTNFRIDPNDPSKDIIMERTNNIEEQYFRKIKRNQRRIHGNRDVGHDLNFYGSYLPIAWNLADDEYIKTVYGSMENIPAVFSQVPYEMFKLEQERFYAERRGRIIKFKLDDSEIFRIIGKGVENMEMQSNGLLTP